MKLEKREDDSIDENLNRELIVAFKEELKNLLEDNTYYPVKLFDEAYRDMTAKYVDK
jgi:hypothetical protein